MKPWRLSISVLCGRVSRVEVVALRCCGYCARIVFRAGNVQVLEYAPGQQLWPELARLLQPESHDEIIGRPELLEADPGLWLALK